MRSTPTSPAVATSPPLNGNASNGQALHRAPAPTINPPRTRRRPALIALGLALSALGALAVAYLVQTAGNTRPVVVVAAAVGQGERIERSDLAIANVSLDPAVQAVPGGQIQSLVGLRAVSALPAGSLLNPESVVPALQPGTGRSLVGLALKTGQLPSEPLQGGDRVRVVEVPEAGGQAPAQPSPPIDATVVSTTRDENSDLTVVNVAVARDLAPRLAAQAGSGRAAVLLESRER